MNATYGLRVLPTYPWTGGAPIGEVHPVPGTRAEVEEIWQRMTNSAHHEVVALADVDPDSIYRPKATQPAAH